MIISSLGLASRVWVSIVIGFLVTFFVIGFGISLLMFKNWGKGVSTIANKDQEEEAMELVPHITLNPSFNIEMLEYLDTTPPEASSSSVSAKSSASPFQVIGPSSPSDDIF